MNFAVSFTLVRLEGFGKIWILIFIPQFRGCLLLFRLLQSSRPTLSILPCLTRLTNSRGKLVKLLLDLTGAPYLEFNFKKEEEMFNMCPLPQLLFFASFTDDKGVTWTTKYIADDKGYRVIGRTTTFTGKVPAPVPEPVPEKIPTPAPAPAPAYFIVAAPTLPSYDAPFLSGFPSFFYPGNFRYIGWIYSVLTLALALLLLVFTSNTHKFLCTHWERTKEITL